MPEREYKIVYTVDNSGALTSLAQIKGELRGLQGTAAQTAAVLNDVGGTMSGPVAQGAHQARDAFGGIRGAMFDVLAAWQLLSTGLQIAEVLTEPLKKARESAKEVAEEVMKLRDATRELANLKGADSPDNVVLAQQAKLMLETGMTQAEANKFSKQFEGTIPAARQRHHIGKELTPQEEARGDADEIARERAQAEQEISREAALFGVRTGMDAGTAGDLGASLAVYSRVKGGKDAAGKLSAIAYGLNEGRGDLTPLSKSLLKTAGTLVEEGGQVNDLGELAAIMGVMSIGNTPDTAGHRVLQASREMRRFGDRRRGAALKEAGITKDDDFMTSLRKLKGAIGDEDMDVWLEQHGFEAREGNRGLIFAMKNLDLAERRITKEKEIATHGEREQAVNRSFRDKSMDGRKRMADARTAALRMTRGIKEEGINIARQDAMNRLIAGGKIEPTQGQMDVIADWGGVRSKLTGGLESYGRRIEDEVHKQLYRSAAGVGMTGEEVHEIIKKAQGHWHEEGSRPNTAAFNAVSREIEKRGGDPNGPWRRGPNREGDDARMPANEEITKRLDRLIDLEEAKKRGRGAADPGAPPRRGERPGRGGGATEVEPARP